VSCSTEQILHLSLDKWLGKFCFSIQTLVLIYMPTMLNGIANHMGQLNKACALFLDEQDALEWRMHEDRRMCSVMWMDRKPVLMLSTHSLPMAFPCEIVEVPCRIGAIRKMVKTSPVHKEYMTYMRGVHVAYQLQGNYTSQVRSHK
jgi:hypothetical protein